MATSDHEKYGGYRIKNKTYFFGKSIVLPHVRYVSTVNSKVMMMFHALVMKRNGKYRTLRCDNMDDSGFCKRHDMSRKEFMERYCNGAGPSSLRKEELI